MAKTVCKLYWNHESYESFNVSLFISGAMLMTYVSVFVLTLRRFAVRSSSVFRKLTCICIVFLFLPAQRSLNGWGFKVRIQRSSLGERESERVNFLNRTFILIVSVCIQLSHQCHPLIRHCHSVFGAKDRRRGSTIMNASSGGCR